VVLNGYVDDSGSSDGNVFVLAGFLATADEWTNFSDEWERICGQDPKTPDFKMKKAVRLKEYKWTEEQRDQRLLELASLTSRTARYRVDAKVAWEDYKSIVEGQLRPEIDSPYFVLFYHVILAMAYYMEEAKVEGTVHWIFDEQSVIGNESRDWYETIKSLTPRTIQRRLAGEPMFESDTNVLPLKAADMFAWYVRRYRNEEQVHPIRHPASFTKLLEVPGCVCDIHADDLRQLVESVKEHPILQTHYQFFLPPD
jgi:hypothetical protein